MTSKKPTLLFVHGAFHGPEYFSYVVDILKSKGYPCVDDLLLPSSAGLSPPPSGLEDSVKALQSVVTDIVDGSGRFEADGPNDCIVTMHSWGGVVGADALGGFGIKSRPGKKAVKKLVFLNANIPLPGDSLASQIHKLAEIHGKGDIGHLLSIDVWNNDICCEYSTNEASTIQGDVGTFAGDSNAFYNDLSPELQDAFMAKLRHHSLSYDVPNIGLLQRAELCADR